MLTTNDNLITKKDNNYVFTPEGEIEVYYASLELCLLKYLTENLKLNESSLKKKMNDFHSFALQTFLTIHDFTSKLPLVVTFIGEKDTNNFFSFIGKHYLNTLEITKKEILDEAIPIYRRIYEDPLRTASTELLEAYGHLFLTAPPLNIKELEQADAPTTEENKIVKEEVPDATVDTATTSKEPSPGEYILTHFITFFDAAPPLDIYAMEEYDQKILNNLSKDETIKADTQPSSSPEEVTTEKPKLVKQITIKEYAQATGIIHKFLKDKDNKGYSEWFNKLSNKYKAMIYFNNVIIKEKQGVFPVWHNEITKISQQLLLPIAIVKQISDNTKIYYELLYKLQNLLKIITDMDVKVLYPKVIELLTSTEPIETKKMTTEFMFLSIQDAGLRKSVIEQVHTFLDSLE